MTASRNTVIFRASPEWAVSSAGEHYVDIVGVTSSILVPPTIHSDFASQKHSCRWHEFRNELCMFLLSFRFAHIERAQGWFSQIQNCENENRSSGSILGKLSLIRLTPRSGSGRRAKPDGRSAAAWIWPLIQWIDFRENCVGPASRRAAARPLEPKQACPSANLAASIHRIISGAIHAPTSREGHLND